MSAGEFRPCKERHLVECFINTIKHDLCLFPRFNQLATPFPRSLSFVDALL